MSHATNKQALFGTSGGKTATPSTTATAATPAPTTAAPQSKTAGMSLNLGKTSATATGTTKPIAMSAEVRQKKINEAQALCAKGEENLKTSFFQWNPDFLSAASNYERAGELFKTADQPKRAIKTYQLSAECYEKCNTLASAALCRGKAAEIAKEMGDSKLCVKILESVAETWGLHGDVQKYGETLEKAAKELETFDVPKAKEMHLKAFEVLCPSSTPREQLSQVHPVIIDISKSIFTFLVKHKFYNEALKHSLRMVEIFTAFDLESGICKALVGITILQIALGDVVKAQQTYLQEHLSIAVYMRSQECDFIDVLVLACVNQDDDLMDKAKMHPQLNYLDKELQTIVKNLSLFELLESGGAATKATTVSPDQTNKSSLFSKKKPAADVPPAKVEEEHHEEDNHEFLKLQEDLNNLDIPDFLADKNEENDENDEDNDHNQHKKEIPETNNSVPQTSGIGNNGVEEEEDDDGIDLS